MPGPCLLSFCAQARCLSVGASNLPGKTSTFKSHMPKTQCFFNIFFITCIKTTHFSMFFPQACLVGYQNSGCEHKGNHSKEIPDPTGLMPIPARSSGCDPKRFSKYQWLRRCSKSSGGAAVEEAAAPPRAQTGRPLQGQ